MSDASANTYNAIFSGVSALFAAVSSLIAWQAFRASQRSLRIAERSVQTARDIADSQNRLSVDQFRRQSVIDLHNAWTEVSDIDCEALVTPDVVRAINCLDLTAQLWLNEVVDRNILHQSYWPVYRHLYETLDNCTRVPPGKTRSCRMELHQSRAIRQAYQQMSQFTAAFVSSLGGHRP